MTIEYRRQRTLFRLLLASTAMATVAACGGGGGGGGGGATNAGQGDPTFFQTDEFLSSDALQQINADDGYARIPGDVGGDGVRVAVLDDGIDRDHIDLSGNIAADLVRSGQTELDNDNEGGTSLGPDGHGTAVAGVIAAAKNDIGSHGVAFDAQILSFDIFTVDDDPTNGTDTTRNIASAIRTAADPDSDFEADIINMSLSTGGAGSSAERNAEIAAVGQAMAVAADNGKIIVVSAGNDGVINPNFPAQFVALSDVQGLGIAVGSVDGNNNTSRFSNGCGNIAQFCMVAPGEGVQTTLINDRFGGASGTSFSAPLVAGSAAVIKAAFPGIGNRDVVNRLLSTARDLGAPGTDVIFGRGLLDLDAALSPVGQTSVSVADTIDGAQLPTSSTQVSLDSSFSLSGDAEDLLGNVMVLDEQNFPFLVDLNNAVDQRSRTTGIESFIGADRSESSIMTMDNGSLSLSLSEEPEQSDPYRKEFAASETTLQKQPEDPRVGFQSEASENVDLFMSFNGTSKTDLGIGQSLASNDAEFFSQQSFLAPYDRLAGQQSGGGAIYSLGEDTKIGVSAFASADSDAQTEVNMQKVELVHRTVGDVEMRLSYGLLQEEGGFIGSSASGAFGPATSTDTQFANISLMAPVTDDISLFGAYNHGRSSTSATAGSLLNEFSGTVSEAFGAGVVVNDLIQDDDGFTLMVGQPLRVSSGSADVTVPVGRTEDGRILKETVRADLSPERREIATEAVYRMSLGADDHTLTTGAFARFNPDHDPDASPDLGIGIKYQLRF